VIRTASTHSATGPDGPAGADGREPRPVPSAFDRARRVVEPSMRRLVDTLAPEVRVVAAYHLGFADADGNHRPEGAGKAARPALALLSAQAYGVPETVAVPGAVAVELVHNFSLLHDDVMDGDPERRHRPTAWSVFGVGAAIVAGDALATLAQQVLLDVRGLEGVRAGSSLAAATARMIAGQAQDLAFESRSDVSYAECLAMSGNKTGAILGFAASVGAILAGAGDRLIRGLEAFGVHLGLAYQAVDDLLGLWGSPEVTGKPAGNDLRRGKKTLPIVAAVGSGSQAGARLAQLLEGGGVRDRDVEPALRLIDEAGGRQRALHEAEGRMAMAVDALRRSGAATEGRRGLEEVASFVTGREF
jgi:geranylgeranyl diphosphate synthase type I